MWSYFLISSLWLLYSLFLLLHPLSQSLSLFQLSMLLHIQHIVYVTAFWCMYNWDFLLKDGVWWFRGLIDRSQLFYLEKENVSMGGDRRSFDLNVMEYSTGVRPSDSLVLFCPCTLIYSLVRAVPASCCNILCGKGGLERTWRARCQPVN